MQFFPDPQTFIAIGSLSIKWYAVIILCGAILAYSFCVKEIKKMGYKVETAEDLFLGCLICGLIGARLWYCAFYNLEYYLANPIHILYTFEGGLAIQGGLFGGVLFGLWYARKHKINFMRMADAIVPNVLLAQGIGRWGNFVNQEAFGTNTTLPWGMYSEGTCNYLSSVQETLAAQGVAVDPSLPVHPTFLYESIWCLLGFFLLWAYMKRRKFHGELILMYVMWYGAERFFVEGLRTDSLMVGSFRISQVIAAVSVIAALCIWLALRKKYKDKPLTVTYTALVKEDGRQVPYEFSWLSGETPPTDAEMKAEIERRRAARAAEETAQAEEKAPETEESGGASGVPEQREAEADTQAAPEVEQAAPVQEAAADAAEKDGSDAEQKE